MGDQVSLSSFQKDLGIPINFQEESGLDTLKACVSGNFGSCLKEVKPLVLYSVEHGIAMEPMKGKWVSSRVDVGYTELFCIPELHQCSSRFVTVFLRTLW